MPSAVHAARLETEFTLSWQTVALETKVGN